MYYLNMKEALKCLEMLIKLQTMKISHHFYQVFQDAFIFFIFLIPHSFNSN